MRLVVAPMDFYEGNLICAGIKSFRMVKQR